MGKQAIESYTQQGLNPHDVGEAAYRLLINPTPPLRNLIMADNQFGQIIPLMCRQASSCTGFVPHSRVHLLCLWQLAPSTSKHILNIIPVLQSFLLSSAPHSLHRYAEMKAAISQATFRQTQDCQCQSALLLHTSNPVCRRYTLPLEEFYVNTPNGPNITAYQNGEPKSHKTFNCSIHCGGQQFCGAGNPGQFDMRILHGLPCIVRPPWSSHHIIGFNWKLSNC